MAISASKSKVIYTSASSTNGYTITASFTENSTNVANNTSSMSISGSIKAANISFSDSAGISLSLQWWDNKVGSWQTVATKTVTSMEWQETVSLSATRAVTHLDNGSLQGQVKLVLTKNGTSVYAPPSDEVKTDAKNLTTIARASVPTSSNITINAASTNLVVNTNRKSSSFTHTITVQFIDTSTKLTANSVTTSHTFKIPDTWLNKIPNAKSGTATITCTTYNGSTNIGSKTCTVTITAGNIAKPTIASPSITETALTSYGVTDLQFVRYLSKKTVRATITGKYGASISKVTFNGSNMTKSSNTYSLNLQNMSTKPTATISVTDSRGLTSTYSFEITWIAYAYPTITNTTLSRNSAVSSDGSLKGNGTYWNGSLGSTANSIQYQYMRNDESTWSDWADATYSNGKWNFTEAQTGLIYTNSFSADIRIKDAYGNIKTLQATLASAETTLWIGKNTVRTKDLVIEDGYRLGMYNKGDIFAATGADIFNCIRELAGSPQVSFTDKNVDNWHTDEYFGTWYLQISNSVYTGTKPNTTQQGILHIKKQTARYIRQIYDALDGNRHYRYYDNTNKTWTAWTQGSNFTLKAAEFTQTVKDINGNTDGSFTITANKPSGTILAMVFYPYAWPTVSHTTVMYMRSTTRDNNKNGVIQYHTSGSQKQNYDVRGYWLYY